MSMAFAIHVVTVPLVSAVLIAEAPSSWAQAPDVARTETCTAEPAAHVRSQCEQTLPWRARVISKPDPLAASAMLGAASIRVGARLKEAIPMQRVLTRDANATVTPDGAGATAWSAFKRSIGGDLRDRLMARLRIGSPASGAAAPRLDAGTALRVGVSSLKPWIGFDRLLPLNGVAMFRARADGNLALHLQYRFNNTRLGFSATREPRVSYSVTLRFPL